VTQRVKVLYLGPDDLLTFVQENLGAGYEVVQASTDEVARQQVRDASYVLDAYMRVRFDADMIGSAAKLKAFVAATTGADHVDAASLEKRGLPLLTLRGQTAVLRNLTPAAELSWLLVMACARGVRAAVDDVIAGNWNRNNHPGLMLRGRTIGIVGCGRIGEWMSRYARAFGMNCLGFDPKLEQFPEGTRPVPLAQLLSESDVVSVHVPLNDSTRGLLGKNELASIKRGAILVNTSRGEIVDEAELLKALEDGRLSAAGLDVLVGEPDIADHPLVRYARAHPNLVITPHIGGFSPDAVREVLTFCCRRIADLQNI
jgi:phosphoglycerate dehydrogenase-like enzyme